MLKDFLSNIGEWYENEDGIHITVPTYRCGVGYTLKYCPFCFMEKLGKDKPPEGENRG
jgi:hypothetical protein